MAGGTRGALIGLVLAAGALAACAADVKLRHPSTGQNAVCPGGYPTRGTVLVIAYRVATVRNADRIVVVHEAG